MATEGQSATLAKSPPAPGSPWESPSKKQKMLIEKERNVMHLLVDNFAKNEYDADVLMQRIRLVPGDIVSKECKALRDESPFSDRLECPDTGLVAMRIPGITEEFLGLEVRSSRLYLERPCYPRLFDTLMSRWEKTKDKRIVLTGNVGIGKSWFQVYFLQRLLRNRNSEDPNLLLSVRFILRHRKEEFVLIDLETCDAWELKASSGGSANEAAKDFLKNIRGVFYLFEPLQDQSIVPIFQPGTPSLLTVSPNPDRLKGYKKEARPGSFFVPIWTLAELLFVLGLEKDVQKDSSYFFKTQFYKFGGVIRRTLDYDRDSWESELRELDAKIKHADLDVIRSMHVGIDDKSEGEIMNNISGYICSYADIEEKGERAFYYPARLGMSSGYAKEEVRRRLGLADPQEHGKRLLECFNGEAQDITGMDLEVSAAHLLSLGPMRVKWEYEEVGQTGPQKKVLTLQHTKRNVSRKDSEFDFGKVGYPKSTNFPLIDFFIQLKGSIWGFQTTWQQSHPFRLATLWSLRQKLGLDETNTLNIVYVMADEKTLECYRNRSKIQYLVKGQNEKKAITNDKNKEVLSATKVKTMWDNTKIFVGYPRGMCWREALETWLTKNGDSSNTLQPPIR